MKIKIYKKLLGYVQGGLMCQPKANEKGREGYEKRHTERDRKTNVLIFALSHAVNTQPCTE